MKDIWENMKKRVDNVIIKEFRNGNEIMISIDGKSFGGICKAKDLQKKSTFAQDIINEVGKELDR